MEKQPRKMVAIVGRPNVGKSALFNRLAGRQVAIVHDRPGVTRDRLISECRQGPVPFDIMDTGGIGETIEDDFNRQVQAEARLALEVADYVLFVVDGVAGMTPVDQDLARTFRKTQRPLALVVNKMDSPQRQLHAGEFAKLGFTDTIEISAAHGINIGNLVALIAARLKLHDAKAVKRQQDSEDEDEEPVEAPPEPPAPVRLAIVGRPNAGKSSLVNAILGQQRTIVSPIAGTTRDSVDIPC
ncbi:MAG: GTPase, partial [Roseimicrobium sp.]